MAPVKKKTPREVPKNEDYFMSMAFLAMSYSKDSYRQEGAVLVKDNVIVLVESNNPLHRVRSIDVDWSKSGKQNYILDSVTRSVLWGLANNSYLSECEIYTTCYPSKRGVDLAISACISKIVYFPLENTIKSYALPEEEVKVIEKIATDSKLKLEKFTGNLNWMRDHVEKLTSFGVFNG